MLTPSKKFVAKLVRMASFLLIPRLKASSLRSIKFPSFLFIRYLVLLKCAVFLSEIKRFLKSFVQLSGPVVELFLGWFLFT